MFKKGLPWETPEIYKKTSPTYGLGNVKTPTVIHVGANDPRCPPGHSRMLHRALKEYVKERPKVGREFIEHLARKKGLKTFPVDGNGGVAYMEPPIVTEQDGGRVQETPSSIATHRPSEVSASLLRARTEAGSGR